MGLAVSSCFISQFHFMICLTGLDGSVGRWVIYVCVCVCVCMTGPFCRSVLLFSAFFFLFFLFVLSFTHLCALPQFLWCTAYILHFIKFGSRPMCKQRRRTAMTVGCKWACASPRFLSSKHWNGTSYQFFFFRNAWRWHASGKRTDLMNSVSSSVLHGNGMVP